MCQMCLAYVLIGTIISMLPVWIPAYAGMTGWEVAADNNFMKMANCKDSNV